MRTIILAVFAAGTVAAPALSAELVARQGEDEVRLSDAPCTHAAVVPQIVPEALQHWRAATARFQGRSYAACWRINGNAAFLLYEDGDQGAVPLEHLKPATSI